MDQFLRDKDRNMILVVNSIAPRSLITFEKSRQELEKVLDREIDVLVVKEKRVSKKLTTKYPNKNYKTVTVNTSSVVQLESALLPYLDKLLLIVCRSEASIPYFKNIIPHVPYLETPTVESLNWSNDKINMRRRLRVFDKKISPGYTIVEDDSKRSIEKIVKKIGFPAIVKPAGLAASVLVTRVYHQEELEKTLKTTFRKMRSVYKSRNRLTKPKILVEEFMEGDLYSTDIYVNARGTMYTTPLVFIKTAESLGKDDFYGYRQMSPVALKVHKHKKAYEVAKQSVEALGLRSITAHVELLRTHDGWKVIEVGPRVGGFREFLYGEAYGIDHALNDMLIRLPMRPKVPRKIKSHAAVLKMYPDKEGVVSSIKGLKKLRELESFKKIDINKSIGAKAKFARNGGVSIADVYLSNKDRSKLLADIRRLEQMFKIEVEPASSRNKLPDIINKTAKTIGL